MAIISFLLLPITMFLKKRDYALSNDGKRWVTRKRCECNLSRPSWIFVVWDHTCLAQYDGYEMKSLQV